MGPARLRRRQRHRRCPPAAEHHGKFYDALDAFQRVSETINDSKMKTGMLREALTECRSYLQVGVPLHASAAKNV